MMLSNLPGEFMPAGRAYRQKAKTLQNKIEKKRAIKSTSATKTRPRRSVLVAKIPSVNLFPTNRI